MLLLPPPAKCALGWNVRCLCRLHACAASTGCTFLRCLRTPAATWGTDTAPTASISAPVWHSRTRGRQRAVQLSQSSHSRGVTALDPWTLARAPLSTELAFSSPSLHHTSHATARQRSSAPASQPPFKSTALATHKPNSDTALRTPAQRAMQLKRQRRAGFSFGGHLFEWPHADDCDEPREHAPDSWREAFRSANFEDIELCELMCDTCKPAREFVLERAPTVSFQLDIALPPDQLLARNRAVSDYVLRRYPLKTGLRLVSEYEEPEDESEEEPEPAPPAPPAADNGAAPADNAQPALEPAANGQHPMEPAVGGDGQPAAGGAPAPGPAEGQANPAPPPEEKFKQGVAKYPEAYKFTEECAKNITRLHLGEYIEPNHRALPKFLTSLTNVTKLNMCDKPLSDAWLKLSLDNLPSLAELTVSSLTIETNAAADRSCHITRLILTSTDFLCLQRLAWVPLPSDNRALHIEIPPSCLMATFSYDDANQRGLHGSICDRLNRWSLQSSGKGVRLRPHQGLPEDLQIFALEASLEDLSSLHLPDQTLHLFNFNVTPALLSFIAEHTEWQIIITECFFNQGPPASIISHRLPNLTGLYIPDVALTDDLLLLLLMYGRCITHMSLLDLDLKSSHAHWSVERWHSLRMQMHNIDMAQYERLPQPLTAPYGVLNPTYNATQMLICPPVIMTSTKVPDGVTFNLPTGVSTWRLPALFRLTASSTLPTKDHADALKALFNHMPRTTTSPPREILPLKHLHMSGWAVTADTESALAHAAARWEGLSVTFTGGLCSSDYYVQTDKLPSFTRMEFVGGCGSGQPAPPDAPAPAASVAAGAAATGPVAGAGQGCSWPVSARHLLQLSVRVGGAHKMTLYDCVLVMDLEKPEEVPVQKPAFTIKHTKPGPTTYHFKPTTTPMAPEARARARDIFPQPDIIELVGWPETTSALTAVSELRPRRALVLGANMTWPAADSPNAASQCRQLGASLPCPSGITWVVHDSCGVSNLVQMILSRGPGTPFNMPLPTTVHVISRGYKFIMAVTTEIKKHMPTGKTLSAQLVPCANMPTITTPPTPPAPSMPMDQLQDKKMAQYELCEKLKSDCNTMAAALRGEADAVEEAGGRMADATALRNKASQAMALAAEAAFLVERVFAQEACLPESEIAAVSEGLSQLWKSVQAS